MKFDVIVADCPWPFTDKLKMSDIKRGAQANYSTMTISDIQQLPIKDICNSIGAVLCLWVPSSLLQEGLDTMKAWGFKHKQTYIWVKTKKNPYEDEYKSLKKRGILMIKYLLEHQFTPKDLKSEIESVAMTIAGKLGFLDFSDILAFGMGRLFRQTHEICLVGTSSNAVYKQLQNKSRRSVCFAENLKHSAKPEALQNSLEVMFPNVEGKMELFSRRQRKGWYCLGNESPMTKGEDIRKSLNKLNSAEEKDLLPINKVISCYDGEKDKELFEMWNRISSDN